MAQPDYGLLDTTLPYKVGGSVLKGMQDVNMLRSQQLGNESKQFEMQNALAQQEAYKQAAQGGVGVSQALMERGLGGEAAKYQKTVAESQKLGLEGQLKKVELRRAHMGQLAADPSDQNIMASLQQQLQSGEITPEQAQQAFNRVRIMNPQERSQYFTRMGVSLDTLYKTETLSAHDKEQLAISRANLGVAQGHLALAQQNQASPEAQALISRAILEGRLDPNKVNSRNRNVIAATLMADPSANLRQLGEEAAGGLAGARSIGTQEANVAMAASEARKMINLAEQYSGKVDRTQYPNINAISNAVAKGTGDANIVQLDAALNSLVNVYARAINPKGVATVADKKHAREIIDRNYSAGQLSAAFQVMDQEMAAAQASGKEARKVLRGGKTELSGEDKAAADWARANPNNPKAAKILQHLGL